MLGSRTCQHLRRAVDGDDAPILDVPEEVTLDETRSAADVDDDSASKGPDERKAALHGRILCARGTHVVPARGEGVEHVRRSTPARGSLIDRLPIVRVR